MSASARILAALLAGLVLGAALIVGLAVWLALSVADRLVRPVGQLVTAARRVAEALRVASGRPALSGEVAQLLPVLQGLDDLDAGAWGRAGALFRDHRDAR